MIKPLRLIRPKLRARMKGLYAEWVALVEQAKKELEEEAAKSAPKPAPKPEPIYSEVMLYAPVLREGQRRAEWEDLLGLFMLHMASPGIPVEHVAHAFRINQDDAKEFLMALPSMGRSQAWSIFGVLGRNELATLRPHVGEYAKWWKTVYHYSEGIQSPVPLQILSRFLIQSVLSDVPAYQLQVDDETYARLSDLVENYLAARSAIVGHLSGSEISDVAPACWYLTSADPLLFLGDY